MQLATAAATAETGRVAHVEAAPAAAIVQPTDPTI